MACPFFMPTEKLDVWSHRPPLPLGNAWQGVCTASGYSDAQPLERELKECNLGYAKHCRRLPAKRAWDAVRFCVSRHRDGRIELCYVCEVNHRPGEHGHLEYDVTRGAWAVAHRDSCVQKMAQCYLEAYVERRGARS